MNLAIWGAALVVDLGLVLGAYVHAYQRGREAGQREQRQIINRVVDQLQRQEVEAHAAIDYLYEQANQHIEHELGREQ